MGALRPVWATAVVLGLARASSADLPDVLSRDAIAVPHPAPRATVPVPLSDGFEPPLWALGFAGQNGWFVGGGQMVPSITDANPASGLQHLRFEDDPAEPPGFPGNLYIGPMLQGHRPTLSINMDIAISSTGGADYFINPQSPTLGITCARVRFTAGDGDGDGRPGDIHVLEDADGPGPEPPAFVNTGTEYEPGKYAEIRIDFPGEDEIHYYYKRELIHSGPVLYSASGFPCNGPAVEQLVLADNQLQPQSPGQTADIDNLSISPEPTTLALLLPLLIIRRSRRR